MTAFPEHLLSKTEDLLNTCRSKGLRIATAEACTGGLIAGCLTAVAGSSDVVERGFITYSNASKQELLGVQEGLILEHGAVSEPVARAMAEGAIDRSHAQLGVAITGIAGPSGATEIKPVGLVHIAAARAGRETSHRRHVLEGDREAIRMQSIDAALDLLFRQAG